jgi:RES domain-containing protein
MLVYRITTTLFANDINGEGSRLNGGRWNQEGVACIYTSATRSLALLEYSCHVALRVLPRALSFVTFEVPDSSIKWFSVAELPGDWKADPYPGSAQLFGTKWLTTKSFLLFAIPSVVIEEEFNYIINPIHPDMKKVRIVNTRDFAYDVRVKK